MESLVMSKAIFSWYTTATNGSSLCAKEKIAFDKQAWNGKLDWLL